MFIKIRRLWKEVTLFAPGITRQFDHGTSVLIYPSFYIHPHSHCMLVVSIFTLCINILSSPQIRTNSSTHFILKLIATPPYSRSNVRDLLVLRCTAYVPYKYLCPSVREIDPKFPVDLRCILAENYKLPEAASDKPLVKQSWTKLQLRGYLAFTNNLIMKSVELYLNFHFNFVTLRDEVSFFVSTIKT